MALLAAQLTYDVSAHDGQRGQVGGAEGRKPARVHLGHSVAPKQLILEEQADLWGRREAAAQRWGAPGPSGLPPAISGAPSEDRLQMSIAAGAWGEPGRELATRGPCRPLLPTCPPPPSLLLRESLVNSAHPSPQCPRSGAQGLGGLVLPPAPAALGLSPWGREGGTAVGRQCEPCFGEAPSPWHRVPCSARGSREVSPCCRVDKEC